MSPTSSPRAESRITSIACTMETQCRWPAPFRRCTASFLDTVEEEVTVETADMAEEDTGDMAAGRTPSWPAWEIQVRTAPRWLARVGTALLAEAVTGHMAAEEDMVEGG